MLVRIVGAWVDSVVGDCVMPEVGVDVGMLDVGPLVGAKVGALVWTVEGAKVVGAIVGIDVGKIVGVSESGS